MFSHVMVGVNDLEASRKFYDAVLGLSLITHLTLPTIYSV